MKTHPSPHPRLWRALRATPTRGGESISPFPTREGGRGVRCFLSLLLTLFLTACGSIQIEVERTPTPDQGGTATVIALQLANRVLATRVATLGATMVAPIGPESGSETIRNFLLTSSRSWKTLWADVRVTDFISNDTAGAPLEKRYQVWVNQPGGQFRVLWSSSPDRVEAFAISDGKQVRLMDAETGQVQTHPMPSATSQPALMALSSELSTPLADLLYPALLAQNGGTFKAVGTAQLAGRDALVVEYTSPNNPFSERLWIDRQTGLFLRRVSAQKGGGKQGGLDMLVTDIQYDVPLPASLFNLQVSEIPQFAQDYTGAAQLSQAEESTPAPKASSQAQLYFYVPDASQNFQLLHLPGKCLLEDTACPFPQVVPNQPNLEGQPQPLLWSPDGQRALMPVLGVTGRLYLYTPKTNAWNLLLETNQFGAAAWSPDGKWFAYAAEKGGTTDIFLSSPDGKQVRNLTGGKLSGPPANLSHLTWQGPQLLLFAETGANGARVYTLEIDTGQMSAVEDLGPKNGLSPLPSPDGRMWAWTEQNGSRITLMMGSAGTDGRIVAGFTQSSIWPLAWSPDGNWLAFTVYGGLPGQEIADLYITGADGTGLLQLYRSQRILAFTWVTGSPQMVVEADDGTGYTHLFLVSMNNGGSRILQAPGLRLDTSWTAPSWGTD